MKKTLALLLGLLLLTGCGSPLLKYPWVGDRQAPQPPATVVTLRLPADMDEPMATAMVTLEAKLLELSGGTITLAREETAQLMDLYSREESGLYLLDSIQMETLDSSLQFARLPFLFPDWQMLVNLLNDEQGMVRGSQQTQSRVGSEILGVYYGGTSWLLSRSRFYDEVGFVGEVGLNSNTPGGEVLLEMGAPAFTKADPKTLQSALADEQLKYCEIRPGEEPTPEAAKQAKYLEPTNHRYEAFWLVLRDPANTLDPQVISCLKEAFAYTLALQNEERVKWEEGKLAELEEHYGIAVQWEQAYDNTWRTARRYYRANYQALGITQQQWEKILNRIY